MSNNISSPKSSINDSYRSYYQEGDDILEKLESISNKTKDLSHKFVKEFFKELNELNFEKLKKSNFPKLTNLAKRVQQLSHEKITYYKTSKLGLITEFFSKLRNLFTLRQFISSGELGKQLIEKTLNKLEENSLYAIDPSLFQEEIVTTNLNEIDVEDDDDDEDDVFYDAVEEIQPEKPKQILDDLNNNQPIPKDVKTLDNVVDNLLTISDNISENEAINEGEDFSDIDSDNSIDEDNKYVDAREEFLDEKSLESLPSKAHSEETTIIIKNDKLDNLKPNLPEVNPTVKSDITATPNYQQEMLSTFFDIWQYASEEQQAKIQTMGNTVFKEAPIKKWEKIKNGFQLTLEREMIGENNNEEKIVMKKSMLIQFVEEKKAKSNDYIQKIIFFKDGISIDLKTSSWLLSKTININIDSIAFDGDQVIVKGSPSSLSSIKLPSSLTEITTPFQEGLEFWQGVTWE